PVRFATGCAGASASRPGPAPCLGPPADVNRSVSLSLPPESRAMPPMKRFVPSLPALLLAAWPLAAQGPKAEQLPHVQHVLVYHEAGRFGGWPANHGIWSWGNEILVGFSAGYHKDNGPARHAIDHARPEEHLLARSRDGGQTWSVEDPAKKGALTPAGPALHGVAPPGLTERPWRDCPGGIDFTHPD